MNLIKNLHAGRVRGQGTGTSDSNVAALSAGEYVLPAAVVKQIGVEKLDAMVRSMTGKEPGGKPVQPMAGKKGMDGYAMGGRFDGVRIDDDALHDDEQRVGKYFFDNGLSTDTVATEVKRAAMGLPGAGEVQQAAQYALKPNPTPNPTPKPNTKPGKGPISSLSGATSGKDEVTGALRDLLGADSDSELSATPGYTEDEMMGYSRGGLISRMKGMKPGMKPKMMGYAAGGLIDEDDPLRRRLAAGASAPTNPAQPALTQPAAGPTRAQADLLRSPTNELGNVSERVQPAYRPNGAALREAAPPDMSELRGRTAGPQPATATAAPATPAVPKTGAPTAQSIADNLTRGKIEGARGTPTPPAPEASPAATAEGSAPAARTGLAQRAASAFPRTAAVLRSLPGLQAATGGISGAIQSFADQGNGVREDFQRRAGVETPLGSVTADAARVLANVGDATTFGLAGRVGRGIAAMTGGGSFGEGFAGEPRAAARPGIIPAAAAQEPPRAPAATPTAAPAPTAAAPTAAEQRTARRGPLAALAAGAPAAQAAASVPQGLDRATIEAGMKARSYLESSPIQAIQLGGTGNGGAIAHYRDGTSAPIDPQAASQWMQWSAAADAMNGPAQPVQALLGGEQFVETPTAAGYIGVPDAAAATGESEGFIKALAAGARDKADPVGAKLRSRLEEITAQGNNAIRVSNSTDRDGEGRGLRTKAARLELEQKEREAALIKQAIEGTPDERAGAVAKLNTLRGKNGEATRMKFVSDLAKAYSAGVTPVGPDDKPLTPQQYVDQWIGAATGGGTVKSNSTAPQNGAVVRGYRFNGGDPADRANWSKAQ